MTEPTPTQNTHNVINRELEISNFNNSDFDLLDLWLGFWQSKWVFIGLTSFFSISSILYSLSLPNLYFSTSLVAPADEEQPSGLSMLSGQLGGLAALTNFNLPKTGDSKVTMAMEVIKSRQFTGEIIEKYDMLVPLMAAEHWDPESQVLEINSDIYDETTKSWAEDADSHESMKPTMQEAYEVFSNILDLEKDPMTGYVNIGIKHISPVVAKDWVDIIIKEINHVMKQRDVKEAEKSIQYLEKQLQVILVADMKSIFYQLIEENSKTIMLAAVRDEYVFTTIDPAIVPEKRYEPHRSLICIVGTILGAILSTIVILISFFVRNRR